MSTVITLGQNSYNLIAIPTSPGFVDYSVSKEDQVATVQSPFVPSQVQTQAFPGADGWAFQFNLPPMPRIQSSAWRGFLSELRGTQNVFIFTPPDLTTPLGVANGAPVCATVAGTNNGVSAIALSTSGWTPNVFGQLMAGDIFNVGSRLYECCENVNSDANGNATIAIWPSLRESPAAGTPLVLTNAGVVLRLSQNKRGTHTTMTGLTTLSISAVEVR